MAGSGRLSRRPSTSRLRTLVISDLHLGARAGADVLRATASGLRCCRARRSRSARPARRRARAAAWAGADRVGRGAPVLRGARRASAGGEVVVLPGNHDHALLRGWLERARQPSPLGLEQPSRRGRREHRSRPLAEWVAPARVRVAYPGVWLREDVYAIHGHYGDWHNTVPIVERLGSGLMCASRGARRARSRAPRTTRRCWRRCTRGSTRSPQRRRPATRRTARSTGRGAGAPARRGAGRATRAQPGAARRLSRWPSRRSTRAGLGPLRADISRAELRRAGAARDRRGRSRVSALARRRI